MTFVTDRDEFVEQLAPGVVVCQVMHLCRLASEASLAYTRVALKNATSAFVPFWATKIIGVPVPPCAIFFFTLSRQLLPTLLPFVSSLLLLDTRLVADLAAATRYVVQGTDIWSPRGYFEISPAQRPVVFLAVTDMHLARAPLVLGGTPKREHVLAFGTSVCYLSANRAQLVPVCLRHHATSRVSVPGATMLLPTRDSTTSGHTSPTRSGLPSPLVRIRSAM